MGILSRKRVRFDSNEVEVFVAVKKDYDTDSETDSEDCTSMTSNPPLSKEEELHRRRKRRKQRHWYTQEDMAPARAEAKQIIRMIHAVGGDIEKIDHSKVCVIGLEKFHNGHENERCRRLLIRSILLRQEMNKSMGVTQNDADQSLFDISDLLSKSFVDFARWQGALNAAHAYGKVATNLKQDQQDDQNQKKEVPTGTGDTPRRQQSVTALC